LEEHHEWKAREGEKGTIAVEYQPREAILRYLQDMREALTEALAQGYAQARISGLVPNPIALRRKLKPWFDLQYDYARHHINPICRTAVSKSAQGWWSRWD
jgi:putative transposase